MNPNFYCLLHEALCQNPAREVVVWPAEMAGNEQKVTTAKNLLDRVTAIGHYLKKNGIRKGQKTVLLLPVGPELISSLLAVMAIGAVPVLPPARVSKIGLIRFLRTGNINAALVAASPGFWASLILKLLGIKLILTREIISHEQDWLHPEPVDPEQAALISHSSGSTAKPKAIYRSHRVLEAQHQALKQTFPPVKGQIDFPLFPNILLHNLAVGVKSVLPDIPQFDLTQIEPERIVKQMQQERINTLTGNVFYFRKLLSYLQQDPQIFPSVSALGIGGSPVPEKLAQALKQFFPAAAIYIIYGSSEAEPIAIRKVEQTPKDPGFGYHVGPVSGSLESKIEVLGKITLPDGCQYETGEILVKGAHVATAGKSWLRTGDFGYLNNENHLFLTGRQGNETLHGGVQHYQIESVLQQLPNIAGVAAKATARGFSVFIVGKASESELSQVLHAAFPALIINNITFLEELPVDARHHSKVLYAKLN